MIPPWGSRFLHLSDLSRIQQSQHTAAGGWTGRFVYGRLSRCEYSTPNLRLLVRLTQMHRYPSLPQPNTSNIQNSYATNHLRFFRSSSPLEICSLTSVQFLILIGVVKQQKKRRCVLFVSKTLSCQTFSQSHNLKSFFFVIIKSPPLYLSLLSSKLNLFLKSSSDFLFLL